MRDQHRLTCRVDGDLLRPVFVVARQRHPGRRIDAPVNRECGTLRGAGKFSRPGQAQMKSVGALDALLAKKRTTAIFQILQYPGPPVLEGAAGIAESADGGCAIATVAYRNRPGPNAAI